MKRSEKASVKYTIAFIIIAGGLSLFIPLLFPVWIVVGHFGADRFFQHEKDKQQLDNE